MLEKLPSMIVLACCVCHQTLHKFKKKVLLHVDFVRDNIIDLPPALIHLFTPYD